MIILYQNVRSLNRKSSDLQKVLNKRFDALCLSETWLETDSTIYNVFDRFGYDLFSAPRDYCRGGGVLIATKKDLNAKRNFSKEDYFVSVQIDKHSLLLVCCYAPQRWCPYIFPSLRGYLKRVRGLFENLIICGDFNTCHIEWFGYLPRYSYLNRAEKYLLNKIYYFFEFIQKVDFPTRESNFLDLVFTNCKRLNTSSCTAFASDHMAILISIDFKTYICDTCLPVTNKFNWKRVDSASIFHSVVNFDWSLVISNFPAQLNTCKLYTRLNKALYTIRKSRFLPYTRSFRHSKNYASKTYSSNH